MRAVLFNKRVKNQERFLDLTNFLPAMQDVQKRVHTILTEKLGIPESEITPDASFVKDLGIDSLDYAELVMEFEQSFDIKIPDEDANDWSGGYLHSGQSR